MVKCEPEPSLSQADCVNADPEPSNVKVDALKIAALRSSMDSTSGISTPQSASEQFSSSAFPDNYSDETKTDFPRWMRLTQPLRFPYVAQIGDEVVYFRQGKFLFFSVQKNKKCIVLLLCCYWLL